MCFFVLLYIFDLFAVVSDILHETFSDIYYEIPFLNKTVNDWIFLCQETCVYTIITASTCFEN